MTATARKTTARAELSRKRRSTAYLTVAERVARGKAARAEVPRSKHAAFEPASNRTDPVELLERQAKTRMPDLVPIRYGRMLVSPFTFYRGGALVMANDLASTPRSGLTVQCCGDAHLTNFGAFASPERRLVFDINDFDETLPGPWEWDVKRLAASVLIAARDNGFRPKDQDRAVLQTVGQYRASMAEFAGMGNLDVWYEHLELETELEAHASEFKPKRLRVARAQLAKAHTKDSVTALGKLTQEVDGEFRIVNQPPLIVPIEQFVPFPRELLLEGLTDLMRRYRSSLQVNRRFLLEQYEIADFARKVVGVGSVGTRAFIGLLIGRNSKDPLFLQAKEAEASVLEEYVGRQQVPEPRRARGAGAEADAGHLRHLSRLAAERGSQPRRHPSRFLRAPAQGLENVRRDRADGAEGPGLLRPDVRRNPRARPRAQRRSGRDRRLPRQQ